MSDWAYIKDYFNHADENMLRGKNSEYAHLNYCFYVLETCRPKLNAKILDLGCGDGAITRSIKRIRPDLQIYGVDISPVLIEKAIENSDDIVFEAANVVEEDYFAGIRFDCIYSFSFVQYLGKDDFLKLMATLSAKLNQDGRICHLSIPDIKKRFLYYTFCYLNQGQSSIVSLAKGLAEFLLTIRSPRMADGVSRWHDGEKLVRTLPPTLAAEVKKPSDGWYRFDIFAENKE